MRKKIVISAVLAAVLGSSVIGYAATSSSFVDVPAKHWSYDAVSYLMQAGIIDGYDDGTFRGDQMMTRNEMAQIVYKAMLNQSKANVAQKALIDKLAAEYALEMNKIENIDERLTKVEKSLPAVKFSGNVRLRWVDKHDGESKPFQQRLRLNVDANINKATSFYGRFEAMNNNDFGSTGDEDRTRIIDAALTSKNVFGTGAEVTYGRFSQGLQTLGYFMDTDGMVDGVRATAGNKLQVTAGYADFAPMLAYDKGQGARTEGSANAYFAELSYDISKATNIKATMFKGVSDGLLDVTTDDGPDNVAKISDLDIRGLSFSSQIRKELVLAADYFKNQAADDNDVGYVARLSYKGAKKSVKGSWGTFVEYGKFEENCGTDTFGAFTGASIPVNNIKAWTVGADYTVGKNFVLQGWHQFNAKAVSDNTEKNDRTRIQAIFNF